MYSQIKNTKGENLYIITIVYTNNIQPNVIAGTWEGGIKKLIKTVIELKYL